MTHILIDLGLTIYAGAAAYERQCVAAVNCVGGVHLYVKNTALLHQPSCRIRESLSPANAAVVATPIQKLCPA